MWSAFITRKAGKNGRFKGQFKMKTPNSIHIIADFSGCPAELLELRQQGEEILRLTIEKSGLSCVMIRSHQFEPSGYTAAALLTESHITLHTWPEHAAVQIDIFTCGSHDRARAAFSELKTLFRPLKVAEKILFRRLDSLSET
jgi:S-adenosylmethionine decarboxylase